MPSKTVTDFTSDTSLILKTFKTLYPNVQESDDLFIIFNAALNILQLFPQKTLSDSESSLENYLKKWAEGYYSFTLPSKREKSPKATCSDPAIKEMVRAICQFSEQEAELESAIHDLFMAAENVQGNLLEEYIAERTKEFGWIWCYGETLRAVDFCSYDGNYLLQIKNKNNTENSSSSAIRIGTTVRKWFRLGSKRVDGEYVPDFKWDVLNEIINSKRKPGVDKLCDMNEVDYHDFLNKVMNENPKIIKED